MPLAFFSRSPPRGARRGPLAAPALSFAALILWIAVPLEAAQRGINRRDL